MPMRDAPSTLLLRGRWFAALPAMRQAELLALAQPRTLGAGEMLFRRGDPNSGLYCVVQGSMSIGSVDATGRDLLLGLMEPPQWFGEIAMFDDGPRTHDAVARGPTSLLWVPRPAMATLLEAQPLWWRYLGQLLSEKVRAVFAGLEELSTLPAPARVARRLLALSEGHGMLADGAALRSVAVNQEQLGAMLSLTRQTVSEVLRDFEARGLVKRRYGAIDLMDCTALGEIGQAPR